MLTLKRRMVVSMMDDGETHHLSLDLRHCQTDPVYRERTLAHDVSRKLLRDANTQPPVIVSKELERQHFRRTIDMAQNKMSIQTAIGVKRPLQIDKIARSERSQVRSLQRFRGKVS